MQYAGQIEGIWHDWFQSVEKTRDAMSSSGVQLDRERSREFDRLGTCDSHTTMKWRETAPPGGHAVLTPKRQSGKEDVVSCTAGSTSRARGRATFVFSDGLMDSRHMPRHCAEEVGKMHRARIKNCRSKLALWGR